MDIIEFDTKDVITTSGMGGDGLGANEDAVDENGNYIMSDSIKINIINKKDAFQEFLESIFFI